MTLTSIHNYKDYFRASSEVIYLIITVTLNYMTNLYVLRDFVRDATIPSRGIAGRTRLSLRVDATTHSARPEPPSDGFIGASAIQPDRLISTRPARAA